MSWLGAEDLVDLRRWAICGIVVLLAALCVAAVTLLGAGVRRVYVGTVVVSAPPGGVPGARAECGHQDVRGA